MPGTALGVTRVSILSNVNDESVRLGKKVTAAREARGWSKADLARKAGVSPSYVTRIEQGKFDRPSIDLVGSIASALKLSVADLAGPMPEPALVDLRAVLMARGFRPDETHIVDRILEGLVHRSPQQRSQELEAISILLRLREERANG
jgi:transcriptional regulator with XRE-family HTH domain